MNQARNVYLNHRFTVTHMKGAKMKKTLCLIFLLFVFTAAKKDQPSYGTTNDSYANENDSWTQPAAAKPAAAPAGMPAGGIPDAKAIEAATTLANNPGLAEFLANKDAVNVISSPGFASLFAGSGKFSPES